VISNDQAIGGWWCHSKKGIKMYLILYIVVGECDTRWRYFRLLSVSQEASEPLDDDSDIDRPLVAAYSTQCALPRVASCGTSMHVPYLAMLCSSDCYHHVVDAPWKHRLGEVHNNAWNLHVSCEP
jgi:hypothetical protein